MKDGYLIFEFEDGDELHIYLIDDFDIYEKICNAKDNDEAIDIMSNEVHDDKIIDELFLQAFDFDKKWFNDYNIKGTAFLLMY